MRIGIFVLAAGRTAGGPETYEVQLIRAVAALDAGDEYFVYCTGSDAAAALGPLPSNFTVRVLRPALRAFSVAATLPRWMAADRIDFFHCTYAAPPFPNRPFLFTMHCLSNFARPEFYPTLIRWRLNVLQRVALRRARLILCVSQFVADGLRDDFGIPPERIAVVYNGVAPEFTLRPVEQAGRRVAERCGIRSPYVLYVGKLQARKNVAGLIRAFARFRAETGPETKLVLAGKRVETSGSIDEAIAATGLRDHVIELGYLAPPSADPDSLLPDLYAAARMTVLPSFHEGFGIPAVEALACGCPLIASNATSLPEVAGGAALLVDPVSVEDMAAAMVRLERDPALRTTLIARGLERARVFTWENCARQTLEAYRRFRFA